MVRFAALVLALAIPVLTARAESTEILMLDFWSPNCGPCMQMKPTIEGFKKGGHPIREINVTVEQEKELVRQFNVVQIPCFVMLVDGQEVDRQVGFTDGGRLTQMFKRAHDVALQNADRRRLQSPDPPQPERKVATFSASEVPSHDCANLLSATVRLRVNDEKSNSYGTGTIIDSRSGQALVITCGHLFRDSKGQGPVSVEMFEVAAGGIRPAGVVPAQLISYDLDRDIALVGIWPKGPVTVAPVAPKGSRIEDGDRVVNVGCSNGQDPTALATRVTSVDRYQNPLSIAAGGAPVEGRSGGGLFNAKGELIGVCFAADYDGNEGLYSALESIHDELTDRGLTDVFTPQPAQGSYPLAGRDSRPAVPIVRGQEPLTPVQPVPGREEATRPGTSVAVTPVADEAVPQGLSAVERAAWEEIMTRAATAEVICIIRPKEPGGQSEVITLDDVSPEFVRALASRKQAAHVK
jgi:thiol-disulfide isomerase/thioredoxin